MKHKFVTRVKKELKNNLKKAATLALLLAVACYLWAPLGKRLAVGGTKPAVSQTSAGNSSQPAEAAAMSHPVDPAPSWKQLAEWIDADALMRPATWASASPNPFASLGHHQNASGSDASGTVAAKKIDLKGRSPEDLGLKLSSTVVGSLNPVAQVNGKNYHIGEIIELDTAEQTLAFRIKGIHSKLVVLEIDGMDYELSMHKLRNNESSMTLADESHTNNELIEADTN